MVCQEQQEKQTGRKQAPDTLPCPSPLYRDQLSPCCSAFLPLHVPVQQPMHHFQHKTTCRGWKPLVRSWIVVLEAQLCLPGHWRENVFLLPRSPQETLTGDGQRIDAPALLIFCAFFYSAVPRVCGRDFLLAKQTHQQCSLYRRAEKIIFC